MQKKICSSGETIAPITGNEWWLSPEEQDEYNFSAHEARVVSHDDYQKWAETYKGKKDIAKFAPVVKRTKEEEEASRAAFEAFMRTRYQDRR